MRGLVPRWGRGGEWQNPTREFAAYNRNSGFSYLGVPAEAGMSDWYENDVTRLLSLTNLPDRQSGESRDPEGGGEVQM